MEAIVIGGGTFALGVVLVLASVGLRRVSADMEAQARERPRGFDVTPVGPRPVLPVEEGENPHRSSSET